MLPVIWDAMSSFKTHAWWTYEPVCIGSNLAIDGQATQSINGNLNNSGPVQLALYRIINHLLSDMCV